MAYEEKRVVIDTDSDVVAARQEGRVMAIQAGFSGSDIAIIATAISEIARNIIEYADHGEIIINVSQKDNKQGIKIVAVDNGPGIQDISKAMQDGYSTSKGLGLGLPGAKRLMDDFEIISQIGKGTKITMKKWVR